MAQGETAPVSCLCGGLGWLKSCPLSGASREAAGGEWDLLHVLWTQQLGAFPLLRVAGRSNSGLMRRQLPKCHLGAPAMPGACASQGGPMTNHWETSASRHFLGSVLTGTREPCQAVLHHWASLGRCGHTVLLWHLTVDFPAAHPGASCD